MDKPVQPSTQPNFPQLETEVLVGWKEKKIFEKTLKATKKGKRFVFFEGPPTANGKPGIHHVLARAFKDVIPRFKTMQGFYVERKAGWDTHGLPVELGVEKALGLKAKKEIEAYGIEKFNEKCKTSVWEYKEEWEKLTERIGFWLDLEHPYITYDKDYIESLWWILKQIWDKELLYQGHKVVPHCPRCGTALSSHEVAQGYQLVKDTSVYVKFRLVDEQDTYVLAWTTTPWTLPGNVALAVGSEIVYVQVKIGNEHFVLAKDRLEILEGEYAVEKEFPGSELVGKSYQPLFDFLDLGKITGKKAYYITNADFVTTEDGTGVVHTAVMYGEDDYKLGEKIGLPKHHTVGEDGKFTDEVGSFAGMFVKDKKTEKLIIEYLQDHNELLRSEIFEHDYPFCWRCDSPLLYYAKNSWFIKMSALRDQLVANNETINWVPENIKEGRFGDWLRDVKDWAISRERYWGTPLPIWQCIECKLFTCIGSFDDLEKRSTKPLGKNFDPHRPFVDDIVLACESCGKDMHRVKELCDVWFDSGSMPFAQWHYPFENKERIDDGISFPANYISEAIDQTRGWFYTLLAISTLLGKEAPFQNVICLGHILDSKGKKMSKHIGNVIDPWSVIDQHGVDALRFHFFTMSQPGEPKLFDSKGVGDVVRKNFLILWNVVSFWEMAGGTLSVPDNRAERGGSTTKNVPASQSTNVLDTWIEMRTNQLVKTVTESLETYQVTDAGRFISDYINDLSTWYVRRSRDRMKTEGDDRDQALSMLQHALLTVTKLLAPLTPFFAESLYTKLGGKLESVHLETWPDQTDRSFDETELRIMSMVRQAAEAGHAAREEAGIKVRQPLPQLVLLNSETATKNFSQFAEILQDELNVKEVHVKPTLPTGKDWVQKSVGSVSIALENLITDELLYEGWVRELIRAVNDVRKQAKLTQQDRVPVFVHAESETVQGVFVQNKETIAHEVRASQLNFDLPETRTAEKTFSLDGSSVTVAV